MRVDTNVIVIALCYFLTNEKNVELWYYVFVIGFIFLIELVLDFLPTTYLLFITY